MDRAINRPINRAMNRAMNRVPPGAVWGASDHANQRSNRMSYFDMGAETLGTLTTQTSSSHDDLGAQVRLLAAAADPLEGRFNGEGRAAFDAFKDASDQIAIDLNTALAAVLEGIRGQNVAYVQGEEQLVGETTSAHHGSGVEFARF